MIHTFTLGAGKGYSVLYIVKDLEKDCKDELDHKIRLKRLGNLALIYANASKTKSEIG